MLTADLVHARRRGTELRLVALDAAGKERAAAIAARLAETFARHLGSSREELEAAIGAIDVGPREHRLKEALTKLLEDRASFDAEDTSLDPEAIRRDVFTAAAAARIALGDGAAFDRQGILEAIAEARGTTSGAIDKALFADLRSAHVLLAFDPIGPAALVALYERAQAQAVLLRAVKVTIDLPVASPGALRLFFRKLKFLRLLHAITRTEKGHRVVVDGPFSLFEAVTKYGLQLALIVPALEAFEGFTLDAELRWGKDRTPLRFRLEGAAGAPPPDPPSPPLPSDLEAFVRSFEALETGWEIAIADDIVDLPGVGLVVPDLTFTRGSGKRRERVHLEVMGYWSRDAVWKRVEWVQAGLPAKMIFAVSSRLRVSEEVLGDDLPSALYVYKGTMNARRIAAILDGR